MEGNAVLQMTAISLGYGVITHAGRKPVNQDRLRVTSRDASDGARGRLFAVADGIGGHNGGEVASLLACRGLDGYYQRSVSGKRPWNAMALGRLLEETVMKIDRRIRRKSLQNKALADMGTTLSCLAVIQGYSIIAHVGDSRIYRLRRRHLTCLTTDHTFVQDMIFEGQIDPARAAAHPMRHVLTRAVGTAEPLEWVDTRIDPLQQGDCFLLCTDGLYNSLTSAQIAHHLSMLRPPRRIAATLAFEAFRAGAVDNITAIVIKLDGHGYSRKTKYATN